MIKWERILVHLFYLAIVAVVVLHNHERSSSRTSDAVEGKRLPVARVPNEVPEQQKSVVRWPETTVANDNQKQPFFPRSGIAFLKATNERLQDVLTDPRVGSTARAAYISSISAQYRSLFYELDLGEEKLQQFAELQLELQLTRSDAVLAALGAQLSPRATIDAIKNGQEDITGRISQIIGPEKYEQFVDYQEMLPAREQVNLVVQQVALEGVLIDAAQRKALLAATHDLTATINGSENRAELTDNLTKLYPRMAEIAKTFDERTAAAVLRALEGAEARTKLGMMLTGK